MRPRLLPAALLALSATVLAAGSASAQAKPPEKPKAPPVADKAKDPPPTTPDKPKDPPPGDKPDVKIETKDVSFNSADGVELQGTLYKSAKGATSPVVMLVHSFDKDPNKGDWAGLANTLAAKGFSVLRFDLRGHGKSTVVNPKLFWSEPHNVAAMPKMANAKPLPNKIAVADFRTRKDYFPMLANDLLAARVALDKMNDAGDVNTSSVYLVGATDAATLGMLYMAAEWGRPQVLPQALNLTSIPAHGVLNNPDWAGMDIAGAVWLSPVRHPSVEAETMKAWVSARGAGDMREKNAMLCVYGATDSAAKKASMFIVNDVLVANPGKNSTIKLNKLPFTEAREVKATAAAGVDLLGKQLGTEEMVVGYLETLEKDRKNVVRTPNRNYTKSPIIDLAVFGLR